MPTLDVFQLAALARGHAGVVEILLATLVSRGILDLNTEQETLTPTLFPADLSTLELQILRKLRQGESLESLYRTKALSQDILKPLRGLRLLRSEQCCRLTAWIQLGFPLSLMTLVFIILPLYFIAEIVKSTIIYGFINKLVELLSAASAAYGSLGILGICVLPHTERSAWGNHVLKIYREHLKPGDNLQGVALYGHAAMRDPPLDRLGQLCDTYYRRHVSDN